MQCEIVSVGVGFGATGKQCTNTAIYEYPSNASQPSGHKVHACWKHTPCRYKKAQYMLTRDSGRTLVSTGTEKPAYKKPSAVTAIYDNGGKTADRYTVVLSKSAGWEANPGLSACLGLSDNPNHPQGFSQFDECKTGPHLGKPIRFSELPPNVQQHIKTRIE